jgi:hypothetical protein
MSKEYKINVTNKFWYPIVEVRDFLTKYCIDNNYTNVLEIGPGQTPFPLSKKFIGYNEKIKDYINLDIDEDKLPFQNKELDFIYSRHTLEDIQNPNFAFKEIVRCCNSGYIETPSPLIEITKGVDGTNSRHLYGGYLHHRYIIWSDIEKCEIYFLPKYSNIIDNMTDHLEETYNIINNYPMYWNNYFIWKDKEPRITMYKNGVNFILTEENYVNLLKTAVNVSFKNTNYFISNLLKLD